DADTIDLGPGHGFRSGDAALYTNADGDDLGGLEAGRTYFIGRDPNHPNRATLHTTAADAIAGSNRIDLAPQTDGTIHTLTAPALGDAVGDALAEAIEGDTPVEPVREGLEEGGFTVDPEAGD